MPSNDDLSQPSPAIRDALGRFTSQLTGTGTVAAYNVGVDVAEPVEDAEAAVCANCEESEDDCECVTCQGCHRQRNGDDMCSNCEVCEESCCSCVSCSHCDARRNTGMDQYICSHCGRCEDGCCECYTCEGCGDRHNPDHHCGDCDRGDSDSCGCCSCGDDEDEDEDSVAPAAPMPANGLCPGCATPILRDDYDGRKRCALCGQCQDCCMSEASECHGWERGSRNNTRALIMFKEREAKFHDDQTLASKRHTIMVVDRSSVANTTPEGVYNLAEIADNACYFHESDQTESYVRQYYPHHLAAYLAIISIDPTRAMLHGERRQKLREFLESKAKEPKKTVMAAIDPNNRHISVELEIDTPGDLKRGRKLHEAVEKWGDSVVEDGSVHTGWEINTSPSSGEAFTRHIRELCDGMDLLELKPSRNCGMHVHVNTKDMGFQDLRRLILLYSRVERAIYDACHPYRLNHQYSAKCGQHFEGIVNSKKPTDFKGDIHAMLYGYKKPPKGGISPNTSQNPHGTYLNTGCAAIEQSYSEARLRTAGHSNTVPAYHALLACGAVLGRLVPDSVKEAARRRLQSPEPVKKTKNDGVLRELLEKKAQKRPGSLRYRSLNLHSFFYRGSVEFRHHEGSAEFHVIHGWGRLCAEIVTRAVKMTDAQINALPKNPRKALLEVLPPDLKEFVVGEWVKNDAILNGNNSQSREWKNVREHTWAIPSSPTAQSSW
jgi:putative amidoligase enzyme